MTPRNLSPAILTALLVLPAALAGCLGGPAEPVDDLGPEANEVQETAPASAPQGSPAAPKSAFTTGDQREVVHPYTVPDQEARPRETLTFDGVYDPEDCAAQPASWVIGEQWRAHPFTDKLKAGDAVVASVEMRFTNSDTAYAELHLWVDVPNQFYFYDTPVADERGEVVQRFDFQFAVPTEGDFDGVAGVGCWYAVNVEPIPYTVTVDLTFAEGVMPSGTPHLLRVSENVRELRVSGAPTEPGGAVTGHYRVFRPDDSLLGEFALNSNEAFDPVPVEAPGDYVIIVDHSEGGMLAVGADAAPADPALSILDTNWALVPVYATSAPGAVSAEVTVDFPRVPLMIYPWIRAQEGTPLTAKKVTIDVGNDRGPLAHWTSAGQVGARMQNMQLGTGLPDLLDKYEWQIDHHRLAKGPHTFTIQAEAFHGEVVHWHLTYVRPGETAAPPPAPTG